jgi:hypothetical protein
MNNASTEVICSSIPSKTAILTCPGIVRRHLRGQNIFLIYRYPYKDELLTGFFENPTGLKEIILTKLLDVGKKGHF